MAPRLPQGEAVDPRVILAFDTTLDRAAATVVVDGRICAERSEDMRIGHAERLFPMIEEVLAVAVLTYPNLDAIAVATGPGSLSGIRIGIAAARGLASALGIPAVGVSVFEALTTETAARSDAPATIVVVNRAPLDRVYLQRFETDGTGRIHPQHPPRMLAPGAVGKDLAPEGSILVGNAVSALPGDGFVRHPVRGCPDPATLARIAAVRPPRMGERPVPLYLRPPDAMPNLPRYR